MEVTHRFALLLERPVKVHNGIKRDNHGNIDNEVDVSSKTRLVPQKNRGFLPNGGPSEDASALPVAGHAAAGQSVMRVGQGTRKVPSVDRRGSKHVHKALRTNELCRYGVKTNRRPDARFRTAPNAAHSLMVAMWSYSSDSGRPSGRGRPSSSAASGRSRMNVALIARSRQR